VRSAGQCPRTQGGQRILKAPGLSTIAPDRAGRIALAWFTGIGGRWFARAARQFPARTIAKFSATFPRQLPAAVHRQDRRQVARRERRHEDRMVAGRLRRRVSRLDRGHLSCNGGRHDLQRRHCGELLPEVQGCDRPPAPYAGRAAARAQRGDRAQGVQVHGQHRPAPIRHGVCRAEAPFPLRCPTLGRRRPVAAIWKAYRPTPAGPCSSPQLMIIIGALVVDANVSGGNP
jgi:hypothetical protein